MSRSRSTSRPSARRKETDRKSTRLNSSHLVISYAVFCLKKKKKIPHGPPAGHARNLPHPLRLLPARGAACFKHARTLAPELSVADARHPDIPRHCTATLL